MRTIGALFVILLAAQFSADAHAAEIEPFIKFSHTSDITRGAPFNEKPETTLDYLAVGATFSFFERRLSLDLSHGRKSPFCNMSSCRTVPGTELELRWYPLRGKQ